MKSMAFKGSNVFMSRKLVPPEIFDALRDAVKLNGAEVFLCSDPCRTSPDDFHIISSHDHVEKFEDLRAKGCNLIGPQCVFSCAREHKALPKQGYTCCLAMDGVKVLASGFDADEKGKIEKIVAAMGGTLLSKPSTEVSFVVVKNVLAAKYKWALHTLKKPIVTVEWLNQCWNEHRIVPQDSFRVLPFSGLTICVTRVPADVRMEMAKVIIQNGGKYSAELNKKCTHLISDAPEGDKYKVAQRWGHIHIVTRKWFDQCIVRRACLDEQSYPVRCSSVSSGKGVRGSVRMQPSQGNDSGNLQFVPSSLATETNSTMTHSAGIVDLDMEASLSQNTSSTFPAHPIPGEEGDTKEPVERPQCETSLTNLDGCVADDSQSEDNDLYLSECRVLISGFESSEMRRLVNMVRRGGGSRYMQFNDKLTHIVVGNPSEIEKKEIRSIASSGLIHVVGTSWLEDCDRLKKDIPVYQRHIAQDLLLPKGALSVMNCVNQSKIPIDPPSLPSGNQSPGSLSAELGRVSSFERNSETKTEINMGKDKLIAAEAKPPQQRKLHAVNGAHKDQESEKKVANSSQKFMAVQTGKISDVFKGKIFNFSSSFPEDRKGEIVQWIKQGQGEVVDAFLKQSAHYTIECHGVTPKSAYASQTRYVSSHWVRSCLEDGCLLEVNSHILYSPLPCWVPFPGFEKIRFCVSQYEEKDKLLLRNLCFVLGAKIVKNLTKNVTHLLCKFATGPKYEAACKWGIHSITHDWIYECVKQNKLVPLDMFAPKVVTAKDQEAGLCAMTQFATQGAQMTSGDRPSQFSSQFMDTRATPGGYLSSWISTNEEPSKHESMSKKARILENDGKKSLLSSVPRLSAPTCSESSTRENIIDNVPDVASAIEDLLEQTSKIHDQKSPGSTSIDETIFPSNCSTLGQDHLESRSILGFSKHWSSRNGKKDECSGDGKEGMYDGFSETQTDSQVVGYEEDLSGRQMLIDKVRTRSSMI